MQYCKNIFQWCASREYSIPKMAWFPKNWTPKDMIRAGEHVSQLKHNRGARDGQTIWGTYKGVRIGVIKTHGQIATIFPDSRRQPKPKKRRQK